MAGEPVVQFVIALIFVLFVGWLITGGPQDYESSSGKFIRPAAPLDSGAVYDKKLIDADFIFTGRVSETE